jgi:hypothetical protein
MFPKINSLPKSTSDQSAFKLFRSEIEQLTQFLKNEPGPNVNPYNVCIWKICSRPLRLTTTKTPATIKQGKIVQRHIPKLRLKQKDYNIQ